jgi:hypothetical protein
MAFIGNISIGTGFFPKGFFANVFAPLNNTSGGTASNTANITQDADAGDDGTATNIVNLDQDATAGAGGTATNVANIDQDGDGGTASNSVDLDQDASAGGTGSGLTGQTLVFSPFNGTFVNLRNLGAAIFQSNAQLQNLFQFGFAGSGGNVSNTAAQNANADINADVNLTVNITI